jgi:hypothetical protein
LGGDWKRIVEHVHLVELLSLARSRTTTKITEVANRLAILFHVEVAACSSSLLGERVLAVRIVASDFWKAEAFSIIERSGKKQ